MIHCDYFTGEPVPTTPVNAFQQPQIVGTMYSDPNTRFQQMNGYQPFSTQPMSTIQGIGISGYNQQQGMMPGYQGNPAFELLQNRGTPFNFYNPMQPQYQDKVVHVPGFNPGSETLFSHDIEQKCRQLQTEMMIEQEQADIERRNRVQGYFNNNGLNYYGSPYYSGFGNESIIRKYRQMAEDLRQEAIDRRVSFNKNLYNLAHNYVGHPVEEKQVDRIFEGYTYTIPGSKIQEDELQSRLSRMVPVSNKNVYINNHNMVHNFYDQFIDGTNMNEFLRSQGMLKTIELMEQEYHNRRDASNYYQQDAYKYYMKKAILERKGIISRGGQTLPTLQPTDNIPFGTQFPTLNSSATMMEDGTIQITAPDFLKRGTSRQVTLNQMEAHFEENRRRFLESIYAQDAT